MMKTASFTDFRQNAAKFLDVVEKGEVVRILRHGKPVADLVPVQVADKPSWKKNPPLLTLSGASLSKAILENRKDAIR